MDNFEKRFNFGIVSPGKLYRSCQPDNKFLEYLKKQYSIKTIIVLRTELNAEEKEFCEGNNIRLIQLPIKSWRRWPEPKEVHDFFELLENSENYPVLMHCFEGKDRTSMMVALYRLGCEKWTLKKALQEMKQWKANWFWRLFIRAEANKVIEGFEEKNTVLLYFKRVLNLIFGFEGLIYAVRHEKNIKIFLVIEAILIGIAIWQGITVIELAILLLAVGAFNALEMINSAVERLADVTQPQFDYRVKVIKDLLAGGMIFIGIAAFAVWAILVFFVGG